MREIVIFGVKINPLLRTEFLTVIESNLNNGTQIVQNGVNAATIVDIVSNEEFRSALKNSDLINVDGMSVVWALRFLGFKVPERVPCPDLAEDIIALAEARNLSVFLLGAREESLLSGREQILKRHPGLNIVGYRNGYFNAEDEMEVVELINKVNPDLIFLGMPSPKKELFVKKYRDQLTAKYFLGVGGFFDILSGITKRAPLWMQKIGMEWLFRFIQEPGRMWRRYIIGNSRFIWLVLREKFKKQVKMF